MQRPRRANSTHCRWSVSRLPSTKAPEWQYYGVNSSDYKDASILMGYNGATPVRLTLQDVTLSGPNNAAADVFHKNACQLALYGNNVGAAGGALVIETTPF